MAEDWEYDTDYRFERITDVSVNKGFVSIRMGSMGFGYRKKPGTYVAKVGDTALFYPQREFTTVRGLLIYDHEDVNNGIIIPHEIFYRTEKQDKTFRNRQVNAMHTNEKKKYNQNKWNYMVRFRSLPQCFRDRIRRFRKLNKDFNWKYYTYELFVCEEAVNIAKHCKTAEEVDKFHKLPYDNQKEVIADGHSGNTFGMACMLAKLYLMDKTLVIKMHGALCNLVGCVSYGCKKEA